MLHDRLLSVLAMAPGGLTSTAIAHRVETPSDPFNLAAVEATLLLSAEVSRAGDRWKLIVKGRAGQLLAAIESYSDSSGKKIFPLDRSALTPLNVRVPNRGRAARGLGVLKRPVRSSSQRDDQEEPIGHAQD